MGETSRYPGCPVALLTQHGKERTIASVLEPGLGCVITHVTGFDTDQLGTFTRDIPRTGSQLDAARCKARKGMELSGLPLGLASEGTFGPDPFAGLLPWNVELLVWIDDLLEIEIVGRAQGPGFSGHLLSDNWQDVERFARRAGFPGHQLVLRPDRQDDPRIQKGIADWARLRMVFEQCLSASAQGRVFIESDLRAFAHPTRLHRIGQAAEDLLRRIQSRCPDCHAPGYWITARLPGLQCADCGLPTAKPRSEVWTCLRCPCRSVHDRTDRRTADPADCDQCNP